MSLLSLAEEILLKDANAPFASYSPERRLDNNITHSLTSIQDIHFKQATHSKELMSISPNTWFVQTSGQQQKIAIRSALQQSSSGCASFYQAEDFVPLSSAVFCQDHELMQGLFSNSHAIEIMRGPGTAFYGNSALYGVINMLSPQFTPQSQTAVSVMGDSHGFNQANLDHREHNIILQLFASDDDGFKDNTSAQQRLLRFKAKQSSDNWQLVHHLNLSHIDQENATAVVGNEAYKDASRKKENANNGAYLKAKSLRYNADFRFYPQPQSELIVTPFLRALKSNEALMDIEGEPQQQSQHYSLGLQSVFIRPYSETTEISSGFDIDYSWGQILQSQAQNISPALPAGDHFDFNLNSWDIAMFIQSDMQLAENWAMNIGLRLQNTRYDYSNQLSDGAVCADGVDSCRYYRAADSVDSYFNWSPHLSLQWQYSDDHFSVINLNKGYRTPHSDELYRLENGQEKADIEAETLISAEWGLHGVMAERLQYRLTAFFMQKDHAIVKDSNRFWRDDQQTEHQGLELNLQYAILEQLIFSTAMSFSRHRYDSNVSLFNSDTAAIKGQHITQAPEQLHQMSLTWLGHTQSLWQYQLQLEAIYLGEYFLDSSNNSAYEGHTLTHFRYEQNLPDQWQIQMAVINLFDVDYAELADLSINDNPADREQRYIIGEPRHFRLGITKSF